MARIPRLYRVISRHRDTTSETRHYQTPEAAKARAELFAKADKDATISIEPSHPVTYPRPSGDPSPLDIPDTLVSRAVVDDFAAQLGLKSSAVQLVIVEPEEVVVQYQPDPTGKRAPKFWRVSFLD